MAQHILQTVLIFSEQNREERRWKDTQYKGDPVPMNFSLEIYTTVVVAYPEMSRVFDTKDLNFNKVDCIKMIRAITGWGLVDAKKFVEENSGVVFEFWFHNDYTTRFPYLTEVKY